MFCTRVALGTAPMTVSIFWPFLKIMTVGMLRMPYSVATRGLSSVFSLYCSRAGAEGRGQRVCCYSSKSWGPSPVGLLITS
jgi:hypothetical protein